MADTVRQTIVSVRIDEKDASEQVAKDLLSFAYTDKETDEAEDVTITLKDETGKWRKNWAPKMNATLKCDIVTLEPRDLLKCGKFHVDSRRVSGSPSVYELRATSIPPDNPIRRKAKERTWKKQTLKQIASTIASENSLTLLWDCAGDVGTEQREQADQKRESDLVFLQKLCKEEGANLKLTDSKLVIFDQKSYESKEPVCTIKREDNEVLRWEFSQELADAYKSVTVTYRDPAKKVRGHAAQKKKEASNSASQIDEDDLENMDEDDAQEAAEDL